MSKQACILAILIVLFISVLVSPVEGSNGNIDQYIISSTDKFKEDFNNELLYKRGDIVDSNISHSDPLNLTWGISNLNSNNHASSSKISQLPRFDNIDMTAITPSTFVSVWNTSLTSTGSSNSNQIRLPLDSSGTYNFNVDWGDGNNNIIIMWDQIEITHTYTSVGLYTVVIDGTLVGWHFNDGGDKLKIVEISQWGDINLGNFGNYFYGCSNLVLTATDALDLTGSTTMRNAFRNNLILGDSGDMNSWDVSGVTDMAGMFAKTEFFNLPLNNWDVSSVTDMSQMFVGTDSYDSTFDLSLNSWDVSSVVNMSGMFSYLWNYNQSIADWDVSSVTDMSGMFVHAHTFNQPLNNWDVSSVTDMSLMFGGALFFNQPLNSWDVSSVTDMNNMFRGAGDFNQDIDSWDISRVTDMSFMFEGAASFNQPLNSWDVSSVTDMSFMFNNANSFNQPLNSWDVSNKIDMFAMFWGANSFNQPLNSWDVSSTNRMVSMFRNANSFDQSLDNWDVSNVFEMSEMFDGVTLSITNYDNLLIEWSKLSLQHEVIFDAGNSLNSAAATDARQKIIADFNWTIYDAINPQPGEISNSLEEETSETSELDTEKIKESLDRVIIGGSLAVFLIVGLGGYMLKVSGLSRIPKTEVTEHTKNLLQNIFNGNTNKYLYLVGGITGKDSIKTDTNIPEGMLNHKFLMQPVRLAMMKILTENPHVTNIEMKNTLGISWGEFSNNLIALRKHNLVFTEEKFIDNVARHTIVITPEGLSRYNGLIEVLQNFLSSPDYEMYVKGYAEDPLKKPEDN